MNAMQTIMVLPREYVSGLDGFFAWPYTSKLVDSIASSVRWMSRIEAESSEQWVQPIPCAIFLDSSGRYCVFRQARQQRPDLTRRVSFIVGGHVDSDGADKPVSSLFEETLRREIAEEIGVTLDGLLQPVGMVVDGTSITASKHIGFVYEVVIDREIRPLSADEFAVRSKYNGQFLSVETLSGLRLRLDPWSSILFSQYMSSRPYWDIGRQSKFRAMTE